MMKSSRKKKVPSGEEEFLLGKVFPRVPEGKAIPQTVKYFLIEEKEFFGEKGRVPEGTKSSWKEKIVPKGEESSRKKAEFPKEKFLTVWSKFLEEKLFLKKKGIPGEKESLKGGKVDGVKNVSAEERVKKEKRVRGGEKKILRVT